LKTAVITGGTKGLGRALAGAFRGVDYSVVALYHSDDDAAEVLRRDLALEGARGTTLRYDVADPALASRLADLPQVSSAVELVLVHNACAPFSPRPFHLTPWDEVARGVATAIGGSFLCTQALLRSLVASRGTIVNVLSEVVHNAPPKGFAGYVAAKYGLLGLTRALAVEYAARGIKVFSVSPGFMETSLTATWDPRLRTGLDTGAASVERVASAIVDLVVRRDELPGQGEDYRVPSP
jgi:3-oxoacyl-[acyl-carrier protein] reductase